MNWDNGCVVVEVFCYAVGVVALVERMRGSLQEQGGREGGCKMGWGYERGIL